MGDRPGQAGRQGLQQPRPRHPGQPSPGRSRGHSSIPGRSGRPAWSRPPSMNSPNAGSRSSTPATSRASMSASSCIPARTVLDGAPSRCCWSGSATIRAAASTTTRRTSCCSARLSRFIDIYHERIVAFHVKDARVQPDRAAGRLRRLPAMDQPRRPFPLARRRPGRFRRHLLQARPVRLRRLGGARMGMLPEASRGRCAAKGADSSRSTSSTSPKRLRRFRRRRRRPEGQPQDARHLRESNDGSRTKRRDRERAHQARHGRRRAGRLHRRRAPPRRADGRPVRTGRRRAVVGQRSGRSPRRRNSASPATASYGILRGHGQGRGEAGPTASRRCRSSRRTTCTRRWPRRS